VISTATAAPSMNITVSGPGNIPFPATTLAVDAVNTSSLSVASAALLSVGDYISVGGTVARIESIDLGAATYQNEVEVMAPAGVGVSNFDALSSTAEDVTLLVGSGLVSGYISYDNAPLSGVWVSFYEDNVLAYKVFSNAEGCFQSTLEAGSNWRIEVANDAANDQGFHRRYNRHFLYHLNNHHYHCLHPSN